MGELQVTAVTTAWRASVLKGPPCCLMACSRPRRAEWLPTIGRLYADMPPLCAYSSTQLRLCCMPRDSCRVPALAVACYLLTW